MWYMKITKDSDRTVTGDSQKRSMAGSIFRKLDDFEAEDVDQKVADKAVKDMGVNATIDEVCTAGDAGYVITTTDKDGYGGISRITVGIKKDGTINGVSILSISETAGLGMKATEPSFL